MNKPRAFAVGLDDGPILPWRLIAGAFLHFIVPAYLVALIVDTLLTMPNGADAEAMLRHALPFSGKFLAVYALIAFAVSLVAAVVDPILRARRGQSLTDACLSEQRLARSVTRGRGLFGAQADVTLSLLQAAGWDHGDARFRSLSADIEEVVRSSATALIAAPERGEEIGVMVARALGHLQDALQDLNRADGDRRTADAQAVARYVELRHGPSDFSSGQD